MSLLAAGFAMGLGTFAFRGTGFRWTGWRGPAGGQAEVVVDDRIRSTVDLYSAASLAQQTLLDLTLPDGLHTVVLRVTGIKSPASSTTLVYVDTLEAVGEPAPSATVEQGNAAVSYSGSWGVTNDAAAGSGSYARTQTGGKADSRCLTESPLLRERDGLLAALSL